jgi:hypothetical protein
VVFKKLADDVPLIMGRNFLQQTQTLTIYRDRLEERKSDLGAPKVMNMTLSRRRLPCYLDFVLVYAVADTGSDLDLMKEDYAVERGFPIESVSWYERFVRLPGGVTAEITGKVKVRFDTVIASPSSTPAEIKDATRSPSVPTSVGATMIESPNFPRATDDIHVGYSEPTSLSAATAVNPSLPKTTDDIYVRYSEPTSLSASTTDDFHIPHSEPDIVNESDHYRTFYVMPSLTANVLLGEELLDSIDAFGTHLDSFVDIKSATGDMSDMNCIKWLNNVERKLIRSSKSRPTWPPNFVKCEHLILEILTEMLIFNRYLARPESTGA